MSPYPWSLLGIAPTLDEMDIRRAYARRLKDFRPDEDPAGFQRLVAARDVALNWRGPLPTVPAAVETEDDEPEERDEFEAERVEQGALPVHLVPPPLLTIVPEVKPDPPPPPPPPRAPAPARPKVPDRSREAYALLNELLGRKNAGAKPDQPLCEVPDRWRSLVHLADELRFEQRETFVDAIARGLLPLLGPIPSREDIHFALVRGKGLASVLAQIDTEFGFAQDQARLARLCGLPAMHAYADWLTAIRHVEAIEARRAAGQRAYRDTNGVPLFPPEDRPLALPAALGALLDKSREHGRRIWRFNPWILLLPGARTSEYGFFWSGLLISFGTLLALIVCDFGDPQGVVVAMAGTVLVLILRAILAFVLSGLAIAAAIHRVRRADRRGIFDPQARQKVVAPIRRERVFAVQRAVEMGTIVLAVIFALGSGIPAWNQRSIADKPPEEVWSDLILQAFEGVAADDGLRTDRFIDFFDNLHKDRGTIYPAWATGQGRRAIDLSLVTARQRELTELLSRKSTPLAARGMARQEKLLKLAARYRVADIAERRAIEDTLAAWRPLLSRTLSSLDEAAVWAAMPPSTDGKALDRYPALLRRFAVARLLADQLQSSEVGRFEIFASTLHYFLTAPDTYWLSLPSSFIESPLKELDLGLGAPGDPQTRADIYFKQVIGRPSPQTSSDADESWAPFLLARQAFMDVAGLCFAAEESTSHAASVEALINTVRLVPERISPVTEHYWRDRTKILLSDSICFQTVMASGGPFRSKSYDQSDERTAGFAKSLFEAGYKARLAGNVETAFQLYSAFINRPRQGSTSSPIGTRLLALAYNNRSTIFFDRGDPMAALGDCDDAVSADPKSYLPYANRGRALWELGDTARAMADFDKSLELEPAGIFALQLRGLLFMEKKNFAAAIKDFSAALKASPDEVGILLARARAYRDAGNAADAAGDYRRALTIKPDNKEAAQGLEALGSKP